MWSKWLTVAALGAGLANTAAAHGPAPRYVYARVLAATPIMREVVVERPRTECWREDRVRPSYVPGAAARIAGATLVGGAIGGAVGHELGHGRDRGTLTAVGTLVGSALAHRRALDRELSVPGAVVEERVPVERCRVVTENHVERRIEAYVVTYGYRGRRGSIRMHEAPGPRVRIAFGGRRGHHRH